PGHETTREAPRFVDTRTLAWHVGGAPRVVAGAEHRMLAQDASTGSATLLARLPPGWRSSDPGGEATTDLLGLGGGRSLHGATLGPGAATPLRRGGGAEERGSENGGEALVIVPPTLAVPADASRLVTSIWAEPWQEGRLTGLPYGRRFKSLRPGDVTE